MHMLLLMQGSLMGRSFLMQNMPFIMHGLSIGMPLENIKM